MHVYSPSLDESNLSHCPSHD